MLSPPTHIDGVRMAGGRGLVWILFLGFSVLLAGAVLGRDNSSAAIAAPAGPPKAKVDMVEEKISGHSISDPYRWLEDADSPATQEFDRQELAYARGILDPLPGRDRIHQKLTELLSIGIIGTPQVGGKYYFYIRRDGAQNQPVLMVREGVHGKDRALVDVNLISADGTVTLDL